MKKGFLIVLFLCLCTAHAYAQCAIGLGVRAGPSFATQDFSNSPNDDGAVDLGPILNVDGDVIYCINQYFAVGLNVEWEGHGLDILEDHIGTTSTVSLIPFFELRFLGEKRVSPYLFLGFGYNINSFSPSDQVNREASDTGVVYDVDMDNTFALKTGMGADFFLTDSIALNAEVGWKYNKGEGREFFDDVRITTGDFNQSVIAVLFGLHYYFPLSRSDE